MLETEGLGNDYEPAAAIFDQAVARCMKNPWFSRQKSVIDQGYQKSKR